jgi:UDP-N-acetylglucosamine 1-carboxyvinyltransferase
MAKYFVEGGVPLNGEITVHGAKNAVLPVLAGTILIDECAIHNCPRLTDVDAARNILHSLGCVTERKGGAVVTNSKNLKNWEIPDDLMREMRSSVVFLGAIIARFGEARISRPGGCAIGLRPIDMHLEGLKRLGVTIREDGGYLICRAEKKLRGAVVPLPFPSVGATENIMLAAVNAIGVTTIHNAAREPEIVDLAGFLNAAGADITIKPNGTVVIRGPRKLHSVEYRVIPDRIAAATYLCCAAATGGKITLTDVESDHLSAVIPFFEETGCTITSNRDTIRLTSPQRLKACHMIRTMPYPGFPTDAQAPFMALACTARGPSVFVETIFESRYKHVAELARMGARIKIEGRVAVVEGVEKLHGASVECSDLRGGAALVAAALAANGKSEISQTCFIERGYQDFDKNLAALGARIRQET